MTERNDFAHEARKRGARRPSRDVAIVAGRAASMALPPDFLNLSGSGRLNAILELKSPDAFIRRLREDEFVYLLKGIGLEDSSGLVRYATPGQRRALFDIDVWAGSSFVPERFDRLVDLVKENGLDFTLSVLKDLEPGVLILSLMKRAAFHTVEEAEDMEFEPGAWFFTPDNVFVVECACADDVGVVRDHVDLIYAIGVEFAHWVIHASRWETVSSVEEQTFVQRRARLADNGFAEDEDIYAIYEPFDIDAFRNRVLSGTSGAISAGSPRGEPLALTMASSPGSLFFWKVLACRTAGTLNQSFILSQTMNLVNRVLGAREKDLSDVDVWGEIASHVVTVVSLGLEVVAEGDMEVGVDVLHRCVPLELYRAGIEFSRPVSILARQIVGDVGGTSGLSLFGSQAATDIEAAASFPVKCPPSISANSDYPADFTSREQVLAAVTLMKRFKAIVQFAAGILGFVPTRGVGNYDTLWPPTFSSVVATAWARQILEGRLSIVPLDGREIGELVEKAFVDGRIRPELRLSPDGEGDDYSSAVRIFFGEALDAVETSLGGISPGRIVEVELAGDCLLTKKS